MNKKLPKNHGKPWLKSDDKRLIVGWNYGMSIPGLADALSRSEFAIKCRLELLEEKGFIKFTKVIESEFIGIINGKNYDAILNMARSIIHTKIDLMALLPYARS